jgi:lysophospholipase L1-like esterase
MKLVLFQGDSITDGCRSRTQDWEHGDAYCTLLNAEITYNYPGQYDFLNRGCAGNRIVDLYARIKPDIIHLKPDILSILIGVNDVWHEVGDNPNGVDNEKFFKIYSMLIEEIKAALPNIKIVILEPFVLKGGATEGAWEYFSTEVPKRAAMAKKIAEKFSLPFIPLQEGFDKLCESAPASYWLGDGVHPTPNGHEFIKTKWLECFKENR